MAFRIWLGYAMLHPRLMKKSSLLSLALVTSLGLVNAAPLNNKNAPTPDNRADALGKKIAADIASGSVSKTDGDSLQRSLARVQKMDAQAQKVGVMSPTTKKTIGTDLDKLTKELARKEKQQTAANAAAADASASPN